MPNKFVPYKFAVKAVEDIPKSGEAEEAIKEGRDPFGVMQKMYNMEAEKAIADGKDPNLVNERLAKLQEELSRRRVMAPTSNLDEFGRVIGATAIGAVRGVADLGNNLDLMARDILSPFFDTKAKERRDWLRDQSQAFDATPAGQFANASPRAQAAGRALTNVGTDLLMAAAGGVGAEILAARVAGATLKGAKALGPAADGLAQGLTLGLMKDPGTSSENPLLDRIDQGVKGGVLGGIGGAVIGGAGTGIQKVSEGLASKEAQNTLKTYSSKLPLIGNRDQIRKEMAQLKDKVDGIKATVLSNKQSDPSKYADDLWDNLMGDIGSQQINTQPLKMRLLSRAQDIMSKSTKAEGKKALLSDADIAELASKGDKRAKLANGYITRAKDLDNVNSFANMKEDSRVLGKDSFTDKGAIKPSIAEAEEGIRIKRMYEDFLSNEANKVGKLQEYKAANIATQEKHAHEAIAEAYEASKVVGDIGSFNTKKLITKLRILTKKTIKNKDYSNPILRENVQSTIDGIEKFISANPQASKLLAGKPFPSTSGVIDTVGTAIATPVAKLLQHPHVVGAFQALSKTSPNSAAFKDHSTKLMSVLENMLTK